MTPEQIAAGAACFQCLNEDQKRAAVLYLLDNLPTGGGGGSGTVTSVSVTTANGVSGSVATATTTPAISLTLGDITPTSVSVTGTAGGGFAKFIPQTVAPTAPATGYTKFADSTGRVAWIRASDGFVRTFDSTLTANRVYTFPDATTTMAGLSVAQTFSAVQTFSSQIINTLAGTASTPSIWLNAAPYTGGTAATTQGLFKLGAGTSAGNSTSGTMLEINPGAGFGGNFIDAKVNGGSSILTVSSSGVVTTGGSVNSGNNVQITSTSQLSWSGGRGIITSPGSGQIQLGATDAAAPVAQTLSMQSVVTGTSNTAGVAFTRQTSLGTGTGGSGDDVLKMGITGGSGTTVNTAGTRMYRRAKETTLTEATATKLFTVPLAAGGYIGMTITATVFAADATDFQTITSVLNVNAVAKSTTITGTITQVDGTAAASSGTLTPVTYTVVDDGSNVLSVKCAATSSLTQTTLSCKWAITMLNSNVSATVTPL